jgi:hypothetical protein
LLADIRNGGIKLKSVSTSTARTVKTAGGFTLREEIQNGRRSIAQDSDDEDFDSPFLGVHRVTFAQSIGTNQQKLPVYVAGTRNAAKADTGVNFGTETHTHDSFAENVETIMKETGMSRESVIFGFTMHKSICDLAVCYTRNIYGIQHERRWQDVARAIVNDVIDETPPTVMDKVICSLEVLKILVRKSQVHAFNYARESSAI